MATGVLTPPNLPIGRMLRPATCLDHTRVNPAGSWESGANLNAANCRVAERYQGDDKTREDGYAAGGKGARGGLHGANPNGRLIRRIPTASLVSFISTRDNNLSFNSGRFLFYPKQNLGSILSIFNCYLLVTITSRWKRFCL